MIVTRSHPGNLKTKKRKDTPTISKDNVVELEKPETFVDDPIESTFSTVRLRTAKVRSCFSAKTVLTMAFQLCRCAERRWIKLHRPEKIAKVIRGVKFVNGIEEKRMAA